MQPTPGDDTEHENHNKARERVPIDTDKPIY